MPIEDAMQDSVVFPEERLVWGEGFPALSMFTRGLAARPLVLFLPGGGHLARIAYGHPDAEPEDFLLTHLSRVGFTTLALSYPSAHPSMNHPAPGMTLQQWAASSAAITARYLDTERLPTRVIALGWSLAGRLARNLAVALQRFGITLEVFIGLSAAPPIPGFGGLSPAQLKLASSGLLDGSSEHSSIFRSREAHLAHIDRLNGRIVIPRDVYARHYVTDSPINFRGEAERYEAHRLVPDLAAAIADQGTFDYANYPLCGVIAAGDALDMHHALTDAAAFGMLNAQALYHQMVRPALTGRAPEPQQWDGVRRVFDSLIHRLRRHVDGGHFFFVGATGARETAEHVQTLAEEAVATRRELSALLGQAKC